MAWRPNVQSGFLRTILGDPETGDAARRVLASRTSGRAWAYSPASYGANPGSTLTVTRNTGNGNLVNAGETWPLLYRDSDRLYNGAYPATRDLSDRDPGQPCGAA